MALTLNDTQEADLLKLLGLPEAAPGESDVELVIDTITDLAAQVEALDPDKPSTVAAAAARSGMEVLDKETAAALRRDAAEGRRVAAAAAKEKVETAVDDAIGKGKVLASRRKHWVTLIEADPEMADVLARIPDETAVPLTAIGHAASADSADVSEPAPWFYPRRQRGGSRR
ncbi:hypothetical protein [Mycolicibacterium iranicum]|uniref:hypothetical protein n=1 Tax=Mycolicibacterium iranicum TaxID=912594 RepID=UPI000465D8C4|nr:hypothetical protein [Mycolicibacterium iranicum]